MTQQREKTRSLMEMALFTAIIVILSLTPLGYIPLGFMNATTVHIPVIIAGIVLGRKKGAFCGFVFGLTSFLNSTFRSASVLSFLFSPFRPFGNGWSLVIAFVPRILIGIVAGLVFEALYKASKKKNISMFLAGVAGSMTNTVLVMGMSYLFFAKSYAKAAGIGAEGVLKAVCTVMVVNGIPEAIIAGIIASAVCTALMAAFRNRFN
ncbi:MAG: ECF transporter S component [Clostridia bacterium]|nr:ECF transporter S component [Clostridia bacterium]